MPADLQEHLAQLPHAAVMEDAGFTVVGHYEFAEIHEWTLDELIGFLYSTSILSRDTLGERTDAFEADLRQRLGAVEPSGIFREDGSYAYDLAYRPRVSMGS